MFNHQFSNDKWDGLWDVPELARYSVITGYTKYYCKEPRVLDLGCGEGVLQQKFSYEDYAYYLGIDFSEAAIEKAKCIENDKARFELGNLNNMNIDGLFDVIIYNESLYYLNDPPGAIRAMFKNLKPGGIFIVSMHKVGDERDWLWAALDEILDLKDKTSVSNRSNTTWTIGVYRIKQAQELFQ
jgi:SAM-dependent methyltransferase